MTALAMSEDQFKARVIELAQWNGWRVTHFRPARTKDGWRTPVEGHKGFPDLVLARDGVVLIRELKSERGSPDADQKAWLAALGHNATVWRPRDLPEIEEILTAPRAGRGARAARPARKRMTVAAFDPTPDQIVAGIRQALVDHDIDVIPGLLSQLAERDPRRTQEILAAFTVPRVRVVRP